MGVQYVFRQTMEIGRIKHLICGHIEWLSTCKDLFCFLFLPHEMINDLHLHTRERSVSRKIKSLFYCFIVSWLAHNSFVLIVFLFLYYTSGGKNDAQDEEEDVKRTLIIIQSNAFSCNLGINLARSTNCTRCTHVIL